MDSDQSAEIAALSKHKKFMFIGNKKRYIEVIQCSGEDMNMVLTNGMSGLPGGVPGAAVPTVPGMPAVPGVPPQAVLPPPPTAVIPQRPLVSPGKYIALFLNISTGLITV